MRDIGKNIKQLRESKGMSQGELAKVINRTRSAVSQYESGSTVPRMGVIEDLAAFFCVPKSAILGENVISTLSGNEKELVEIMRSLTPEGRKQLMVYARGIAATYPKGN